MRIAIIGAGIIGVTSAYELVRDGHEVTVFERCGTVAAETSFANAGVIAPSYVTPWAQPDMPAKVLRHLFNQHRPVRIMPTVHAGTIAWLWKCWRACRARTYQANRLRMQRLAGYSRDRLHELTRSMKLDYERSEGHLVLLRSANDLNVAQPWIESLKESNTRFDMLDATQCLRVEPGLNPDIALHAGLYLPDDEVGNCRQFAFLLRAEAQRLGVSFRFNTQVGRIVVGPQPALVHTNVSQEPSRLMLSRDEARAGGDTETMADTPDTERFDAIVVCAALGASALLRPHGLNLPLQAVHGYSVTAPLRHAETHPELGPRSALMDERYKVAISRLGTRVRVAGSAEIGGSPRKHNNAALATLYKVLHDWFPGVARLSQEQRWKGARPMLPDGPPVLGSSGLDGVWLNLGHGSSGWALACGSARRLADAVAGRDSAIDTEGLGIGRLKV